MPQKIVYIVGMFRSGTTVLGDLLALHPGFIHSGELHQLWSGLRLPRARCSCGKKIRECPAWNKILETAFGSMDAIDLESIENLHRHGTRSRQAMLLNIFPWLGFLYKRRLAQMRSYTDHLVRVNAAILRETGNDCIVDSSKWPSIAQALASRDDVELSLVHIVRDSRAVTWSWLSGWHSANWKQSGEKKISAGEVFHWLVINNLTWVLWNFGITSFSRSPGTRYLRVRYEDLTGDPQTGTAEIARFVGISSGANIVDEDNSFERLPCHSVGGNPNRFKRGRTTLRTDNRWMEQMPAWARWITIVLTWPALIVFRYLPGRRRSVSR